MDTPNAADDLLTVRQVADKLQLRPDSVRRHVRAGNLPAPIRIGTCTVRWRASAISAHLASLQPNSRAA
jgi:predicted DNA-binding transcriptional regulator AlpA